MKALIIGGTKGFGKELSNNLIGKGYEVYTTGRTKPDFNVTKNFKCDVGKLNNWLKVVNKIKKLGVSFDLVVFVAGYARAKQVQDFNNKDWEEHFTKNVTYVSLGLEKLKEVFNKGCNVVTIGSKWSFNTGFPALTPYIVSKHALRVLTENFSKSESDYYVNHYCVPTMNTPQKAEVEESFKSIGLDFNVQKTFVGDANPSAVAKMLVEDILDNKNTGKTLYINSEKGIIEEIEN